MGARGWEEIKGIWCISEDWKLNFSLITACIKDNRESVHVSTGVASQYMQTDRTLIIVFV